MSGICGICQPGRDIPRADLESMLSRLALADETQRDIVAGPSTALGVARRWTFQQAGGTETIRVAVDADLQNLDEISALLANKGIEPAPLSLAQQLAWLYQLEGAGFVERLRGAFSLALWDESAQRLLLAIDRMGIHSLYWSFREGRLLFASRAGAVRAAQDRPVEVNPLAVMQFLLFSVVPAPLTIYRGMEKLRPGSLLVYEHGQVRQRCYWDVNYTESEDTDVRDWAREVREKMRAAVHLHLAGCRPEATGAYLSGGTDSSSVVAFMSERFAPVNTFSIFFPEKGYSEIGFARTTAERFHTRHHDRSLSPQDAREAIPRITEYYDEPFANSSAIGAYFCAKLARENGMDTLLAGDGGDELFAGNERYATDKYFAVYHSLPTWLRRGVIEPLAGLLPRNDGFLSLPGRYIRRAHIPNPRRIFSYNLFLSLAPGEVFTPEFLEQAPPEHWLEIVEGHFRSARARSELNRLLYMDLKLTLADNDLRKVCGTAELAGIRVRYPLLDYELTEFSGRIPSKLKLKGFQKRYIFKQAMKGVLPHQVLYKKKHGFGVPLGRWFLQDAQLQSFVQDVLGDPRTRQRGYFRPEFFDQLTKLHQHEHAAFYGESIWYLLALELWHRKQLEDGSGGQCVP